MLECKATLRVRSDALTLEEISQVLGKPTSGFSKGQVFGRQDKRRTHTQWNLQVGFDDDNMQACIIKILDFYRATDMSSIQRACDMDIFCMVSSDNGQGSFTFDTAIYQKLLDVGLSITFDCYIG